MKSILRTLVLAPVALAVVAFTANTAHATTTVKVPFNFTVNGKQCPAGMYSVDSNSLTHILHLRSIDSKRSFNWVVGPGDASTSDTRVHLKFDENGAVRALQSIQYGSQTTAALDRAPKHIHQSAEPTGLGK